MLRNFRASRKAGSWGHANVRFRACFNWQATLLAGLLAATRLPRSPSSRESLQSRGQGKVGFLAMDHPLASAGYSLVTGTLFGSSGPS